MPEMKTSEAAQADAKRLSEIDSAKLMSRNSSCTSNSMVKIGGGRVHVTLTVEDDLNVLPPESLTPVYLFFVNSPSIKGSPTSLTPYFKPPPILPTPYSTTLAMRLKVLGISLQTLPRPSQQHSRSSRQSSGIATPSLFWHRITAPVSYEMAIHRGGCDCNVAFRGLNSHSFEPAHQYLRRSQGYEPSSILPTLSVW